MRNLQKYLSWFKPDWAIALLTLFTLFVGIFALYESVKTFKEGSRAYLCPKDGDIEQLGPPIELGVQRPTTDPTKANLGLQNEITVTLVNSGATPALDATGFMFVSNWSDINRLPPLRETISPVSGLHIIGKDQTLEFRGALILTNELKTSIMQDKLYAVAEGEVKYRDIFNEHHVVQFCYFYYPHRDTMVACPSLNSLD